jgi:hypothetical protein
LYCGKITGLKEKLMNKVILIALSVLVWLVYDLKKDIEYNKMHIERSRYQTKQNRDMFLNYVEMIRGREERNRLAHWSKIGYNYTFYDFETATNALDDLINFYNEDYIGWWDARHIKDRKFGQVYLMYLLKLSTSLHRILDIQDMMPGDDDILENYFPDIHVGEQAYVYDLIWVSKEIKKRYKRWIQYEAEYLTFPIIGKRYEKKEKELMEKMDIVIKKVEQLKDKYER